MDTTRDGRTRVVVGVVAIVALLGTAVVAQQSLLATVGRRVSVGDLGGLLFVAWVTLLLVVALGKVADAERAERR